MVYQLNDDLWFPKPFNGEEDGLIAIGGDLSVDRLLLAYSHGIFPWYAFRKEDNEGLQDEFLNADGTPQIRWYCPLQRFVIFPSEIHISHSMRQMMRSDRYTVTFGQAFDDVIAHCSGLRINERGAWLGDDMIRAYRELHAINLAMSVEVWDGDELIGGLYGVTIGRNFFGESMFSLRPSASKLALITLAQKMESLDMGIIDCQLETPHLRSMGGKYISYEEYMEIIG